MNRKLFPSGLGISSLLVIFGVLCLCVFVLLSVSTVQSRQQLADAAQQRILDYYQADAQAQEILAQLRNGHIPQGVTKENGIYSYSCPISDSHILLVEVICDNTDYEILRWQTVAATQWLPEDSLPVWDGK